MIVSVQSQRYFTMARAKEFDETAVLNKALNVFWCKGFNGTSAQDLVDALGISRSSLYDTFGDKRNLFIQSLQYYRENMSGRMIELIDKSENIEKTVSDIFKAATTEAIEDKLSKGCFIVNSTIELASHDKEVASIINQNIQDIEDALCKAIKKGQDEGIFSTAQTARAYARFLFNNISGIRVASRYGADKHVYDDIVKITLSVLK